MIKGMDFLNDEREKDKGKSKHCPICSSNGDDGALCERHAELSKDYRWLKNYINNQEVMTPKVLYLLNFAISDRVSYIINDVEVINGKLAIEEFLKENLYDRMKNDKKVKCSEWMEKVLKEILALQKARATVIRMMANKTEVS